MAYKQDSRFLDLGTPNRIWAIPSIHGDVEKLADIHDTLYCHIAPGDRIVYLGNYTGYSDTTVETIDELLLFRRNVLSIPGIIPSDFAYLKGLQEDLWEKLLQLQFAPNPSVCLEWMLKKGIETTLKAYGTSSAEGFYAAKKGVVALTKWTNTIRERAYSIKGHKLFRMHIKRAALTLQSTGNASLLFVNAGIDIEKTLEKQNDNFWFNGKHFNEMNSPYQNYSKVIRGFDPAQNGLYLNGVAASLDAGCGFGGPLVSACISPDGTIADIFESA